MPRNVKITTPDKTNPHFSPRQQAAKHTTNIGAAECIIVLSPMLKYFCAQMDINRAKAPAIPPIYTKDSSKRVSNTIRFNLN